MTTLTDFLFARIAEDEGRDYVEWWQLLSRDERAARIERKRIECEAKRRIVEQFSDIRWLGGRAPRDFLFELLALPYADHPDYREEWRP